MAYFSRVQFQYDLDFKKKKKKKIEKFFRLKGPVFLLGSREYDSNTIVPRITYRNIT